MKLSPIPVLRLVSFVSFVALVSSLSACAPSTPPSFVSSAKSARKLTLYAAPARDVSPSRTSEPTLELHGETLFAKTLTIEGDEARRLAEMLVDPALFRSHVSGKKCGGFHADYAVEWPGSKGNDVMLLCFGCGEARSVGEGEDSLVDLSDEGRKRLEDTLQTLGKRR